jgi:ABC-type branched-subunit amino acid transport system ATPase component
MAIFATLASTRLAPILVQGIFAIVKQINKEGVTVLLVEQNVIQTLSICNRACVLENGRIGDAWRKPDHRLSAELGYAKISRDHPG